MTCTRTILWPNPRPCMTTRLWQQIKAGEARDLPLRLSTNGLGSLVWGRDITGELVDAGIMGVTVALNTGMLACLRVCVCLCVCELCVYTGVCVHAHACARTHTYTHTMCAYIRTYIHTCLHSTHTQPAPCNTLS